MPLPRRVRIVIADVHPIFRDGLKRLLESDPGLEIVGESPEGTAAAALVRDACADILLLGLSASEPGIPAALAALPSANPVRTILLTNGIDRPQVTRALQLGAQGVIPRDSTPEVLFKSIHSVMDGHFWVGRGCVPDVKPGLRELEVARRRSRAFGLTRRELDIVRAVVDGCTNREIAERSSISENTVKSHIAHIFNKLGASNRVELAMFASHHCLIDGV